MTQTSLKFCFFCMDFFKDEEWDSDCQSHLLCLPKQCGLVTYRSTIVRPAFCLLCRQDETLPARQRMQSWERDADAIRHISEAHGWRWHCKQCDYSPETGKDGLRHLADAHGIRVSELRRSQKGLLADKGDAVKDDVDMVSGDLIGVEPTAEPLAKCSSPPEGSSGVLMDDPDDDIWRFISFPPTPDSGPTQLDSPLGDHLDDGTSPLSEAKVAPSPPSSPVLQDATIAPVAAVHSMWKPEDSDPSSLLLTSTESSPTASDILTRTVQPDPAVTKPRKVRIKLNVPAGGRGGEAECPPLAKAMSHTATERSLPASPQRPRIRLKLKHALAMESGETGEQSRTKRRRIILRTS